MIIQSNHWIFGNLKPKSNHRFFMIVRSSLWFGSAVLSNLSRCVWAWGIEFACAHDTKLHSNLSHYKWECEKNELHNHFNTATVCSHFRSFESLKKFKKFNPPVKSLKWEKKPTTLRQISCGLKPNSFGS